MSHTIAIPTPNAHSFDHLSSPSVRRIGEPGQDVALDERGTTMHRLWRSHEIDLLEDERRRLARDLHDEAGHRLTAAVLQLDAVAAQCAQDADLRARLEAVCRLIQECASGLHEVAFNLRPSILADLGLVPALRSLARRTHEAAGLPVTVEVRGVPRRLPERIELAAFRIVQEALTNVLKYARASSVTVLANFSDGSIDIAITDDGIGFDLVQERDGRPRLGLRGIQERAELVGGEMRLQTEPGRGTTVAVRMPWSELT